MVVVGIRTFSFSCPEFDLTSVYHLAYLVSADPG